MTVGCFADGLLVKVVEKLQPTVVERIVREGLRCTAEELSAFLSRGVFPRQRTGGHECGLHRVDVGEERVNNWRESRRVRLD